MVCFYYMGHAGVFIRKGKQEDGGRRMIAYFFILENESDGEKVKKHLEYVAMEYI